MFISLPLTNVSRWEIMPILYRYIKVGRAGIGGDLKKWVWYWQTGEPEKTGRNTLRSVKKRRKVQN